MQADATLAADINAELDGWYQSFKDKMNWGVEKVEEKAHAAKESIKSGVDKVVP